MMASRSKLKENIVNVKRNLFNALVLAAVAGLVGFLVATVSLEPVGRFNPNYGPAGSGLSIETKAYEGDRYYVYPADVQEARKACFRAERVARDIPDGAAYLAWFEANHGNAAWADWDAAYQACKINNNIAGARWSDEWYGNLVQVR
jgi:hypothetical protein